MLKGDEDSNDSQQGISARDSKLGYSMLVTRRTCLL